MSPLDALWAHYQSQPKKVKKAFIRRIEAQNQAETLEAQMRSLDASLPADEREKLHRMASDIRQRAQEIELAAKQGKRIGRSADEFLAELRKEL